MAVSAKPCNTNLSKIHMDFANRGICRGIKMRPAAFYLKIGIILQYIIETGDNKVEIAENLTKMGCGPGRRRGDLRRTGAAKGLEVSPALS